MNLLRFRSLLVSAAVLGLAAPALAGPPLLCFPFEIGQARSLPVGAGSWQAIDTKYDASRLVDDTAALLTPATPVIVRMETLRRATLYAAKNPAQAAALLDRLQQRASVSDANAALAVFDFGYLVETYKQASYLFGHPYTAVQAIDGYSLVSKAAAMSGDAGVDFALAVMTRDRTRGTDVYRAHLAKVLAAAPGNRLIDANLSKQFGNDLETR
jgi:hypothetical protein